MGDRDKHGKELPRSSSPHPSRDRLIRPVNPVPRPPPPPPPNGPNRGRRELPRLPAPHPGRDRMRDIFVMPPIHEARRPPHQDRDRRIVIELPAGPGRRFRQVRERVITPYNDPNRGMRLEPGPPAVAGPSYDLSQGIIAAGAVGSSALVPSDTLPQSHSDYGFSILPLPPPDGSDSRPKSPNRKSKTLPRSEAGEGPSGSGRTFRTFIRSFRQRLRGFVPFMGHVEPRVQVPPSAVTEARKGSQPSTDGSLSMHPSLESTSLNIPDDDGSDDSDSETDEYKRPVNTLPLYSEESLSKDRSDSDRSRTPENPVDRPVIQSSEDIARESSPDPSLDRSLTPDTPVYKLLPSSSREDSTSDEYVEQAEDHGHVNPSGALSAEEVYRISVSAPVNIQIAYEDSGHVTTCIRHEPARYVFDDDVVSDMEESRSDDEGNYYF